MFVFLYRTWLFLCETEQVCKYLQNHSSSIKKNKIFKIFCTYSNISFAKCDSDVLLYITHTHVITRGAYTYINTAIIIYLQFKCFYGKEKIFKSLLAINTIRKQQLNRVKIILSCSLLFGKKKESNYL